MTNDLLSFLDASPSPFHAVAEAAERLRAAGFHPIAEHDQWPTGPGRFFLVRDGSLVAWIEPDVAPETPFGIAGAHTDSPNLRLKPRPEFSRAGYALVGCEVYGSALTNSWLDRDLGLSGRLAMRDGSTTLVRIDEPIMRIPQLAIHLDPGFRERGVKLNPQHHLNPIWAVEPTSGALLQWVRRHAEVDETDVVAWELMVHDTTPAALCGIDQSLLASGRIDNLVSCWCLIETLRNIGDDNRVVVGLFDHEEVGSTSASGAASTLLPMVVERIVAAAGGTTEHRFRALAGSVCLSADGAHATHPNYVEKHDPNHHIEINGGPVVKTNSNVRYATTARSHAAFAAACQEARVPMQVFVSRSDAPCGSTIGPVTSSLLGVSTVDAGVAQLAMHSARETAGAHDPERFVAALRVFLGASWD